jgi:hypothetical protein
MPDAEPQNQRLPRSFHNTFVPERQYINAMMSYAASGQSGDMHEISEATGIPTGKSSGKVIPILDYCRGMGLVSLTGSRRTATKETEVTAFGRTVLLEDPYLKEPLTQWLAHLHLCGSLTGADVWYQTFFAGKQGLGMCFSREKLEEHLALVYGVNARSLLTANHIAQPLPNALSLHITLVDHARQQQAGDHEDPRRHDCFRAHRITSPRVSPGRQSEIASFASSVRTRASHHGSLTTHSEAPPRRRRPCRARTRTAPRRCRCFRCRLITVTG